jgi:hypothetical protein
MDPEEGLARYQRMLDENHAHQATLEATQQWLWGEIRGNVVYMVLGSAAIMFGVANFIWGPWWWAMFVTVPACVFLLPRMIRSMVRWYRFKALMRG